MQYTMPQHGTDIEAWGAMETLIKNNCFMTHIDKAIFSQPNIAKRLRPLSKWYWIGAAVGVVCSALLLAVDIQSSGLSSLLIIMASAGLLCLLIVVCYYLFGDCRGAYSTEVKQFMDRTVDYYSLSMKQKITAALESGDFSALEQCKRIANPDLILIRYHDSLDRKQYAQLLSMTHDKEVPLTDVFASSTSNVNQQEQ